MPLVKRYAIIVCNWHSFDLVSVQSNLNLCYSRICQTVCLYKGITCISGNNKQSDESRSSILSVCIDHRKSAEKDVIFR